MNLTLYPKYSGQKLETCELSKESMGAGKEVSCNLDYSITSSDEYYICLSSSQGTGEYKTKGYVPTTEKCGAFGVPGTRETAAYPIFFQKVKYGDFQKIVISDYLKNQRLSTKTEAYLRGKYGSLNCGASCLVPIKLTSNQNQTITLDGLRIEYTSTIGSGIEKKEFTDFAVLFPKITSGFQKLNLDQGKLSLSSTPTEYTYALDLDNQEILEETIEIKDFSIDVNPKIIPELIPTTMRVYVDFIIQESFWDFGDNQTQRSLSNTVVHTYSKEGTYNLQLKIIDMDNQSFSKNFSIQVNNSKQVLEEILEDLNEKIKNIETQMLSLDLFTEQMLRKSLGLDELKIQLKETEQNLSLASDSSSYGPLVAPLLSISFPESIIKSSTNAIVFYPDKSVVKPELLSKLKNRSYDSGSKDNQINSILGWQQQNFDVKISSTDLSVVKNGYTTSLFTVFSVDIRRKKGVSDEKAYVFIKEIGGLEFDIVGLEKSVDGYKYFKVGNSLNFQIHTTEPIETSSLSLFIAPEVIDLDSGYQFVEEGKTKKRLWVFILLLLIVVVLGIIGYVLLKKWYKNKYESHLFPNKNNLYNMVTYVNTSKKKGLTDMEIRKNLKKAGWNQEQINYVMKKYKGKNTGMVGFKKKKPQNLIRRKS